MALLILPDELLFEIPKHIHRKKDLNALVRTSRQLQWEFKQCLYRFDKEHCASLILLWAVTQGETRTAQIFWTGRAGNPTKDNDLQALLQFAVENGRYAMVLWLLHKGADVNAPCDYFGNILQIASWLGNQEMMKLLIDQGAHVNALGGHYGSALQAASWAGSIEMMQLLLDHGANANAQSGYFGNALQGASWVGDPQRVKLLISYGANVNAQGGYYGNALQAASRKGHRDVVKLLIKRGAAVDALGGYYDSAYHAALVGGHNRVAGLLQYWHWRQSATRMLMVFMEKLSRRRQESEQAPSILDEGAVQSETIHPDNPCH
jgi:hypothetical protein